MDKDIDIVHFHNGTGGGVFSVIRNLLKFSENKLIHNHVIFTINKKLVPHFTAPKITGAASVQVFCFSPDWNFNYTCRQLAKLVPGNQALIVAHDWLELGMVSNLGLQNPVVQFLHGHYNYYFNLAVKHDPWVDSFISIAAATKEKLQSLIPSRSEDIHYCRFPVPDVATGINENKIPKILFAGRCEKEKGYNLLPVIAKQLEETQTKLEWHIVGEHSQKMDVSWPGYVNVTFHGLKSNEDLLSMLPAFKYFILPSLAEGMPVTVIEAMKAGVIPIVNDLPGGLQEIVLNGETGYRILNNNVDEYVKLLNRLQANFSLAAEISAAASRKAKAWFNPVTNTSATEAIFLEATKIERLKPSEKIYGSMLDENWIPNVITASVRRMVSYFKK